MPQTVMLIADLMSEFAATECGVKSPVDGHWWSTTEEPVFIGSYRDIDWHFDRWEVDDFEAEVAHVVTPNGHSGFLETDGVWNAAPRV